MRYPSIPHRARVSRLPVGVRDALARGGLVLAASMVVMEVGIPGVFAQESGAAKATPTFVAPRAVATPKLLRYAERIVRLYDVNQDGHLGPDEWQAMHGQPASADLNHDGQISVAEFAQFVANFGAGRAIRLSASGTGPLAQGDNGPGDPRVANGDSADPNAPGEPAAAPAADPRRGLKYFAALPAGIPAWFVERDADGDSQLTLSEFSPKLLKREVEDFNRYDANHDGLLTPQEFLRADKSPKTGG